MLKSYKCRLYPNKQQEFLIQKTFGCVRFVYNQCLDYKIRKYKEENISLSWVDIVNYKTRTLKETYTWLKEVDNWALNNAVINMDGAFKKFFRDHKGFPKFKNKKTTHKSYKTNYSTNNNIAVNFDSRKIKLPKLKWVKVRGIRYFVGKIKSATISQSSSGKYYVSIFVDKPNEKPLPKTNKNVGIDLGLKDFAITSDGDKIPNPKYLAKSEKRLVKLQRQLSRKSSGSNNRNKARIRFARAWDKVKSQRTDFLQKLSTRLIREHDIICLEDLNIKDMMQNHCLAKSIGDVSWSEFVRMLYYKAEWYGKKIIQIDRFFPSSQTCSVCGAVNSVTKDLSVREWMCPECGTVHDRDVNAAKNILTQGLAVA